MKHAWNKMAGIAADIEVSQADRQYIEGKLSFDPRGRWPKLPNQPPRVLLLLYGPMIAVFLFGMVAVAMFRAPLWLFALCFAVAVLLQIAADLFITRIFLARRIREELRAMGYEVCVKCGHSLRGSARDKCPECGAPA
jgi:hypothetical protein